MVIAMLWKEHKDGRIRGRGDVKKCIWTALHFLAFCEMRGHIMGSWPNGYGQIFVSQVAKRSNWLLPKMSFISPYASSPRKVIAARCWWGSPDVRECMEVPACNGSWHRLDGSWHGLDGSWHRLDGQLTSISFIHIVLHHFFLSRHRLLPFPA